MLSLGKVEKGICIICSFDIDDIFKYGEKYKYGNIVAHYFCLLFSCGLEQNGEDEEGIYGFLVEDILREVKRGRLLKCKYCKNRGATSACCLKRCQTKFHFPCGLKNLSLHQYFGEFSSYCFNHRPFQRVNQKYINPHADCPICYMKINYSSAESFLFTPCCKKVLHRDCIQKQSLNSGYFFKCPICNNKQEFVLEMQRYGIYVPEKDASWELEEDAFIDLLFRYARCDAPICFCPQGREFDREYSQWDIAVCRLCAAHGAHVKCGKIKCNELQTWVCQVCSTIENRYSQIKRCSKNLSRNSNNLIIDSNSQVENVTNSSLRTLVKRKLSNSTNNLSESSSSTQSRYIRKKRQQLECKL